MPIIGYDHCGVRVTDAKRSQAFYEALGFRLDPDRNVLEFNELKAEEAAP
jgi:catechol 2,3-dioxygenase-like lactoylglutathione lyase family enzyme